VNSTEIMISIEDGKEIARFWADSPNMYSDELPPSILQAKVDGSQYAAQVAQEIEDLGLGAMTSDDVLGVIGTIFGIIQAVLSAFGLIALGVASLGVINTLIMAIYERTREIGVMKAVGASKSTIRLLFTVEGASIGFLGGIIGVAVAYALGSAINWVSHITFLKDFETFKISVFPWWLIVGVIALSTIIALLAALYPAHRASNLDPIEALRYE
ncbi:MAG: FtsX-like permease family protein, partial [Dehalococcoidia bacterium]